MVWRANTPSKTSCLPCVRYFCVLFGFYSFFGKRIIKQKLSDIISSCTDQNRAIAIRCTCKRICSLTLECTVFVGRFIVERNNVCVSEYDREILFVYHFYGGWIDGVPLILITVIIACAHTHTHIYMILAPKNIHLQLHTAHTLYNNLILCFGKKWIAHRTMAP